MNKEILKVIYKVHELFKKRRLKLSVAESCTGGLISHYLTAPPGASIFFEGGVVSYSIEFKNGILGVSSETISRYGVVSEETAKEMADKIRVLTRADFSLSTTGNLGPEVLEDKEKGLVYVAVSKKGQTLSRELRFRGERESIKEKASLAALEFLIEVMEKEDFYAGEDT
jgi:PncC family amidohydrolase